MYKFDIFFHKELLSGGEKVVTYASILKHPQIIGEGENLEGATGELSLVKDGQEKGFSINTLLFRYNSQLIGNQLALHINKNMSLKFLFTDFNDATQPLMASILTPEGEKFNFNGCIKEINTKTILHPQGKMMAIIPLSKSVIISESDHEMIVASGELILIPAKTKEISLQADKIFVMCF